MNFLRGSGTEWVKFPKEKIDPFRLFRFFLLSGAQASRWIGG